jgi:hypothetical protein
MTKDRPTDPVERRILELREFYSHLVIYLVINGVLAVANWFMGPPRWVLWPLFGWGVGLAAHAAAVLVLPRLVGPSWEARTRERLERMR